MGRFKAYYFGAFSQSAAHRCTAQFAPGNLEILIIPCSNFEYVIVFSHFACSARLRMNFKSSPTPNEIWVCCHGECNIHISFTTCWGDRPVSILASLRSVFIRVSSLTERKTAQQILYTHLLQSSISEPFLTAARHVGNFLNSWRSGAGDESSPGISFHLG